MIVALLLSAALVQEAPAAASDAAPASTASTPGDLKDGERKMRVVCRTEVTTGTRFGKRTCISLEDFKRREKESQEGFAEMQRSLNTTYSKGN